MDMKCKWCNSTNIIAKGTRLSEKDSSPIAKRYLCNDCGRQFSVRLDNTREKTEYKDDKNISKLDWREWCDKLTEFQDLHSKASFSQDHAKIDMTDKTEPIVIINIQDWHFGARGTDYQLIKKYTDEIINTPNVYIVLSEMLETAVKMRNVKEMSGQLTEPEMQISFLESWLKDISHRVLASFWDNHSTMREEAQVGYSTIKRILGKQYSLIYYNGIGYLDINLGSQTYKLAMSHFFKGNSIYSAVAGQKRYARMEGTDREILMAGHSHCPAYEWFYEGQMERVALNCGTLNINSGYAKRFHSLFTLPKFPCVEIFPDEHIIQPYSNLGTWAKVKGV